MSIVLRGYQTECVDYFAAARAAGAKRVPAVLSTGAGKTMIFTHPAFLDSTLNAGKRVLIIAHSDELIEQAAKKARLANPRRRVGIVKAQLNQCTAEIVVASVQTMRNAKRREAVRNVGLVVIDECHHSAAASYLAVIEHYKDAFIAGFTATFARGDKKKLSAVWEVPEAGVFSRDILYFIRRGYLLDVAGKRIVVPDFDMSRVRQSAGDYRDGDIAEELERTFAPEIIAQQYAEHATGRKGIAFWPLVDTAYHGAKAFNEAGIRSEVIHGELPKQERRALLQRLHSGETRVVHGVGVLTEGWDDPTVDVCVIARPTRSAGLYQQMAGRVLRPNLEIPAAKRGKALILDVVGAAAQHDLRSLIDLSPERALNRDLADDGESLLEISDQWEELREQEGGSAPEFVEDYDGPAAVLDFDPLGRASLWSKTPGGTYFMSAGSVAYAFLVPSVAGEPSHWDVALCSKPARGVAPWAKGTEYVDLPMDIALAEAEELAHEVGGHGAKALAGRKSAWRKAEPTPSQVAMARGLGIATDGMTKGQVSEAIDAHKAARRLDPLVAKVLAAAQAS